MKVRVEKRGRRIEVRSSTPIKSLNAIPGAYQAVAGHWTVPLSLESCKLLREEFGKQLKVGTELRRWARGVAENRRYMAGLAASEDARLDVLPRVAPKLHKAMKRRKYQRVGARFIADNPATLVADDPGLGKTLQVMAGILEAEVPGPYLIIAPKTASDAVWRREINRWLPNDHTAVTLPDFRHQREKTIRLTRYGPKTWLIVHPEIILVQTWWVCQEHIRRKNKRTGMYSWRTCGKRTVEGPAQKRDLDCGHVRDSKTEKLIQPSYPKLFEVEWGAIVIDESHESLIRRKGVPTQRRRGLDMLRTRADGLKIAMSGTPFDSKPHQLWGTLNWLDPLTYSAFYRWAQLFWSMGGYGGWEVGEFRKDREQMLWDSLSSVALRRTKFEVAKDLPPKMYVGTPLDAADSDSPVGVWLEMDSKQAKAYEEMERASATDLASGRLEAVTALAELTRLKQLASSYGDITEHMVKVNCFTRPKLYPDPCDECRSRGYHREIRHTYTPTLPSNKFTWTVDSLEEWGYPRNPLTKVVIVSWYTGILEEFGRQIEKHFRTKANRPLCSYITGKTPSGQRRSIIDEFNRTDRDSAQIMMLNVKAGGTAITLDTADRMIFLSETRSPDQQKQAEDRIHRVSNPRHCMYYYLRSLGTVDVGTALANQEAERITHRLLDERRGVEYFRRVLDLSHPL